MKTKLIITFTIVFVILAIPITFMSLNPMEFYSAATLVWALTDPEVCGKFMAPNVLVLFQENYLKNVMTLEELDHVQDYFVTKQTELKKSAMEFNCINVVENQGLLPFWPDMQQKVLEIWKANDS